MTNAQRKRMVRYLSRFNVDTLVNLQGWPDARLVQSAAFVRSELETAKTRV